MATVTTTVLFTDLVGSTALMSRVGEVTAEALRREHFSLLRDAFAAHDGREVKNLGDGLMVVFPSSADAVLAAVAMQQAFERRNRRAEHEMSIRVGVAVGDVDEAEGSDGEAGDVFGVPVVQASRLCAAAAGGEILCTEVVRILAGSRAETTFEPLGGLELKGLDGPVDSCRVTWEPVGASDAVLPRRLASSLGVTFAGRTMERERIIDAWKAAVADAERRVVLLSGEPGIGKTTLSARVAASVLDDGGLVVYGRSDSDLGVPYQPWIEALAQVVAQAEEDVVAAHVADRGAHLARLVPELSTRTGTALASGGSSTAMVGEESERFVLFGCVADLLERVSADRPVLIVLDDLHWADRQSLHLLRHVVTSGRPMRVLVLGTFRDSDVASGDPVADLLAALHREQGIDRIALEGLSDTDLLDVLEEVAGHEMDDRGLALRDAVLAETAGNPFFVGEILRHLVESGVIYRDGSGRWVGDGDIRSVGLPVSVKEVVGRRLAALDPDAERVLAAASVIGRDFDIATVAAVVGLDEDVVVDLCDAAVSASVLSTTDRIGHYTFAHALIEHTLYDGLSPTRRARTHAAVAEAIETVLAQAADDPTTRAGELAHHWTSAVTPAHADKALHYALLAGHRALDQLAPDDALGWFTRALDLHDSGAPDDHRRAQILLGLGEAQKTCGRAEHRETLFEAARLADETDQVDLLVRAVLRNGRNTWNSNVGHTDHDRVRFIARALERCGDHPGRPMLLARSAVEQIYETSLDHRLALVTQAVDLARRDGDAIVQVWVLQTAVNAVPTARTLDQRLTWLEEGLGLVELIDDPSVGVFYFSGITTALEAGDADLVHHLFDTGASHAEKLAGATQKWEVAFLRATTDIIWSDLATAEANATVALTMGTESGQPDAIGIFGPQLLSIRRHQGRSAEMVPLVEDAIAGAPTLLAYRAVLAYSVAWAGDLDRASDLLDDCLAKGLLEPDSQQFTVAATQWAEAAVLCGHRAVALDMRERLVPYAHHIPTVGITVSAAVASTLGNIDRVFGDLDEADRWHAQADRVHERIASPLLITSGRAAWARVLAERGRGDDHRRAREMATAALEAANAGGWGVAATDARAALHTLDHPAT